MKNTLAWLLVILLSIGVIILPKTVPFLIIPNTRAENLNSNLTGAAAITETDAIHIAKEHLDDQTIARKVDPSRVKVRHLKDQGIIIVDFAWQGAEDNLRGSWSQGYYVKLDELTGEIYKSFVYEH